MRAGAKYALAEAKKKRYANTQSAIINESIAEIESVNNPEIFPRTPNPERTPVTMRAHRFPFQMNIPRTPSITP